MAQQPITMEQVKQIFQLHRQGVGIREIVRRTGISRNSVRKYIARLGTMDAAADNDLALNAYGSDLAELDAERLRQLTLHLTSASTELSKTGVTRQLLWKEYLAGHPDGYSYSRYCYHLEQYLKNRDLSMHLEYDPADMIMIDFAGKKQHYIDTSTGEQIHCQVFVAILPFSGLIFCEAVHTQQTADFTQAINAMLKFYGGVPATILCDNLKAAVKRCDRYEPDFTDICMQLSDHYGTTFSATRPYSPRDKAMVERAVNIVYRHIYAPLRNHCFTSLEALTPHCVSSCPYSMRSPIKTRPTAGGIFLTKKKRLYLSRFRQRPSALKNRYNSPYNATIIFNLRKTTAITVCLTSTLARR
ncbi:MAG: IS21 family transposase [Niabella sp.]